MTFAKLMCLALRTVYLMLFVGAACDDIHIAAEHVVPSVTRQYALHIMNALVVDQLCSDGLAGDHVVQQLFADDDACQIKLHECAVKHASSTTSTAPSSQNNQPDGQLGTKQTETTDQLRPAPLLSQLGHSPAANSGPAL